MAEASACCVMSSLQLAHIRSPRDLDGVPLEELEGLCGQIRSALIDHVFQTGGHLGSNLGVVELTVALHQVFDFEYDRLVFDVSHQCYPHKMLTGRYAEFPTLRQTDGLSGFCSREESAYDQLTAGHAGTAISFAAGLAEGLRGAGQGLGEEGGDCPDPWSVALVGDAGFGAGVSFEGLTQAADRKARLLVILNDNEWSIARSVGALARYLSRIRSSRTLQKTYESLKQMAASLPLVGPRLEEFGEVVRHTLVPGHVFEGLGVNYIGPLDGHDLGGVVDALERAQRMEGVTLLHFLTQKGKGYEPAGSDPERAHGVKPKPAAASMSADAHKVPAPKPTPPSPSRKAFTAHFSEAALTLAARDERVHAITAAMPSGTGLNSFADRFPERFHDTGITEQHAVALAGGMATAGKRPLVAIYSTFLQRGYDQVFQEVALQKESVIFCLDRAGLVGQDGPTHMGLYDLAYLQAFPGMVLASPRDGLDMERMLQAGLDQGGPWALRWPRGTALTALASSAEQRPAMDPGRAERLREGADGTVFALGAMVEPALEAAEKLSAAGGPELTIWDARFAKPLDREAILAAAATGPWLATVEEHSLQAGFGASVAALLADAGVPCPLSRHGVSDHFVPHMSSREEQLAAHGLDLDGLAKAWGEMVRRTVDSHR